jgi:predicted MFS family arabinose efflux permease
VFTLCGSLGIFFAAVVGGTLFDLWRPSAPYVVMGGLSGVLCVLALVTWLRGPSPQVALK